MPSGMEKLHNTLVVCAPCGSTYKILAKYSHKNLNTYSLKLTLSSLGNECC